MADEEIFEGENAETMIDVKELKAEQAAQESEE